MVPLGTKIGGVKGAVSRRLRMVDMGGFGLDDAREVIMVAVLLVVAIVILVMLGGITQLIHVSVLFGVQEFQDAAGINDTQVPDYLNRTAAAGLTMFTFVQIVIIAAAIGAFIFAFLKVIPIHKWLSGKSGGS